MQLIFLKLLETKALDDVPQEGKPPPDPNCALVTAVRVHYTRAGTWVTTHTIRLLHKGRSTHYLDERTDMWTSTEMGRWTLRLYNLPSLSNKKKNFKGTIFMSAKPDQMGPKKKADSPESLPGLRFPVPVMERLSLIQGSITATHTHTEVITNSCPE